MGRRKLADLTMGHPGRLSIGLAATATVLLLILIGVAAYTMPARFDNSSAPTPLASGTIQPAPIEPAPAAPAVRPAAAPSAGSLISATFSQLPQAQSATAGAAASAAAGATPLLPAAPTTHVVKTTTIKIDPPGETVAASQSVPLALANPSPAVDAAPAAPSGAAAPAASAPAPAAMAPAPDAKSIASVSTDTAPVPMAPPAKEAKAKVASVEKTSPAPSGAQMKVGGSGVSVRAGPSKSKSVLFNLAAGQKVTVGSRQRGWVQITDAQGRSGWAYSDYLRKL
jgi:hypothetical protein